MITPKNWMTLVSLVVEQLPVVSRARVTVYPDVVEAQECQGCGGRDFCITPDSVECSTCRADLSTGGTPVNLAENRPRVGFYAGGRRLASAVLVRHEHIDVVVPELADGRFRGNSRAQRDAPSALAGRIFDLLVSQMGSI
jgi:hypothetical protein